MFVQPREDGEEEQRGPAISFMLILLPLSAENKVLRPGRGGARAGGRGCADVCGPESDMHM